MNDGSFGSLLGFLCCEGRYLINRRVKDCLKMNFGGSFQSGTKDGIGKKVGRMLPGKKNGRKKKTFRIFSHSG